MIEQPQADRRTKRDAGSKFVNEKTDQDDGQNFPDEIAHLDVIEHRLGDAIIQANASVDDIETEYAQTKRYMVQQRGEMDPHEMFRSELALAQMDSRGAFAVDIRNRLEKLKDSPYFARIDFREPADRSPATHYIGRFAFSHNHELLISDWRAPIASLFYDHEVGQAGYVAPDGRIDGELSRKRQFKIKNGEMEYAFESSLNVQDDVLQRELSHTSDEKMKSIIATIQKEQNQIIRNEKAETLLIQGVAGSGKTSIALHRIAYLLYRYKNTLTAKNVTILSPNDVFGDYISNVLPELGEESVFGIGFADLAEIQLEGVIRFQPDRDPFETDDQKWAGRARFKSTLDFVRLMDGYLEKLPETIFEPSDYTFERSLITSDWILNRFRFLSRHPIKRRLMIIADDINDRFETDNFLTEARIPKTSAIFKRLTTQLKLKSTLALYKDFYKKTGITGKFVMPAKQTLEWADVFPFLYFHAAFEGLMESRSIKHLVIDEMQDYTPVQYAVLNIMFKCPKTILGDFGQFLNPNHLNTLDDLRNLYADAELVKMNKSYRSTFEIITFAKRVLNVSSLEAVERHGDAPDFIHCRDASEEIEKIKDKIAAFQTGENATLGIILKTNSLAKSFYELLAEDFDIQLISPDSKGFSNGVSVTSVQMSKGLEFDEVIIPSANSATYSKESDRGLLYIACTRAMHRLSLTYTGEPTPLVGA